jgi:hypothetical protein
MAKRTINWQHPNTFTDGSAIDASNFGHFEYRIDDGAAVSLPNVFDPDTQYTAEFDDAGLSVGAHQLDVRLVGSNDKASAWVGDAPFSVVDERVPSDPFGVTVS